MTHPHRDVYGLQRVNTEIQAVFQRLNANTIFWQTKFSRFKILTSVVLVDGNSKHNYFFLGSIVGFLPYLTRSAFGLRVSRKSKYIQIHSTINYY